MREMKKGDLAFFYASGGKNPGIVGIMEVVKEHEPDVTAWNVKSYGFVEKEKDRGKWCVVHVEYRNKLKKPVYRSELQKHLGDGPLGKMQEFNAARLSVSKVSEDEWNFIHENLITGFEDEQDASTNGEAAVTKKVLPPSIPSIVQSTESEQLMTDGIKAATSATLASSRAASCQPSAKPASRRGSRAGSLAPPTASRAGSRARSNTPASAAARTATDGAMQTVTEEN